MTSRLQEIVADVHEALDDATVEQLFGREYLMHHAGSRRVVWIREQSPIEEPNQAGGRLVPGGTHRVTACAIKVETVTAHIYAEDDEAAEMLLDNLLAAISLTFAKSYKFYNYIWVSDEAGEAGRTNRTEKVILRVSFRLPVADEIRQLRSITGITHECGTLTEDGDLNPQPD